MQFRTRKAAFIALVLSDHALSVFPDKNLIFHPNGDVTVNRIRITLTRKGQIRVVDSPLRVKVSQPDTRNYPIASSAAQFANAGDEWGNPNYEHSAAHILTRTQPDGTRILLDHDTIQGYEDHGPVPRPEFVPDPEPDAARIEAGRLRRIQASRRIMFRARMGLK